MRLRKKVVAAVVAVALLPVTGCSAKPFAVGPQQLAFLFETWDKSYAPLPHMLIAITGTGLDKNGELGRWYDEETDVWSPYPMKVAKYTPFSHSQTVSPGEAAVMSFTGTFLGNVGQYLTCSVFVNGEVQPNETQEARVEEYISGESTPTTMLRGAAVVTCSYTLAAPLSK